MLSSKLTKLTELRNRFNSLKDGNEALLELIKESELPEAVYNSNAIENSTLTLPDTERVLLELEVSKQYSIREVFEAKNLARVTQYIEKNAARIPINQETLLFLHNLLIGGIDDSIAGRFRQAGEFVRVGSHIAPAPEHIVRMIEVLTHTYASNHTNDIINKIASFHLEFETIHPFCDGNGRIGRVLINLQLQQYGYPHIIIRDKEKSNYYDSFKEFRASNAVKKLETIIYLSLVESLNKRITYLEHAEIITLSEYSRIHKVSLAGLINKARRQTIPAFREKGVWKISKQFDL